MNRMILAYIVIAFRLSPALKAFEINSGHKMCMMISIF